MKSIFKITLSYFIFILISSCSAIELFESTKIKRYKSVDIIEINNTSDEVVSMDLFGANISKTPTSSEKKGLWDLSDRGQLEYIKTLNTRNKTNSSFSKAIGTQFDLKKPTNKTDYTEKSIKMVFSISKERRYNSLSNDSKIGYSSADRIEYLKFRIEIDSALPMNFNSWNKFETEYKTINLGDISFNRTFSATGGVGSSFNKSKGSQNITENDTNTYSSATSYTPSLSATAGSSNTENIQINNRFISLTGKLKDKVIEIEQEGNREIDLAGNVVVDVSLRFDPKKERIVTFEELFIKKPAKSKVVKPESKLIANDPSKIKLKFSTVKVPNFKELKNIKLALSYDFVYRHVKNPKGRKTEYEYDDKIVYYKNRSISDNKKMVSILRPIDYMPKFARIGFFEDKINSFVNAEGEIEYSDVYHEFNFRNVNRHIDTGVLAFTNENLTNTFINWMVKSAQNIHKKIESAKMLSEKTKSKRDAKTKLLVDLNKEYKKIIVIGDYELVYDVYDSNDSLESSSNNVTLEYIYKHRHLIDSYPLYNLD